MKVLTIGDLHGRDNWKTVCFGGTSLYDIWVTEVENDLFTTDNLFNEYDYIIFIGDYVDSFTKTNKEILENLKEIVFFKRMQPDRVILLLGNHDNSYAFGMGENQCSGNRSEMYYDLNQIFKSGYFQAAFQLGDYLWSHAGLTETTYNDIITRINKDLYRFKSDTDAIIKHGNIADLLNFLYDANEVILFTVSKSRGGRFALGSAGIFWCDLKELQNHALSNINQVVGHSTTQSINKHIRDDDTLYFIDCIQDDHDEYLVLDFNDKNLKVIDETFLINNYLN